MTITDVVPWKWGGLRRWGREEEPFGGFRQQMESLHREMDRVFESMAGDVFRGAAFPEVFGRDLVAPQIDETEDDKAFHVSVELPGMDEKDVHVTLADRLLTIRGEKKIDEKEEGKDYYRRERSYGSFRRTIELPGEVDESKIAASFKKGVLEIELPKTKEAQKKVRQIDIKAA